MPKLRGHKLFGAVRPDECDDFIFRAISVQLWHQMAIHDNGEL